MNETIIHRAPWVIPIAYPPISDGAVAVQNSKILDVGLFSDLKNRYPTFAVQDHKGSVLLPALINAHIHLELSHINIPQQHKNITGFTNWIEKLLETRERNGTLGELPQKAAFDMLMQQYNHGVIGLADIGNTNIAEQLADKFPGILLHFNEVLGRSAKSRRSILHQIEQAEKKKLFTAHAPYSTHAELIQAVKHRARKLNYPFPIHVAEPPSENELLNRGSGNLYDFLLQRNFINKSFEPPAKIDKPGSVQYLDMLGVLDEQTICVHCIHVNTRDIQTLAETKTKICLCPGSNRYLKVGRAPVKQFLESGLLPSLGTDSSASNPELSLWREMRLLQEDHPEVTSDAILKMATSNGARSLGIEKEYGSLEKGKKAEFISVRLTGDIQDSDSLLSYLVKHNEDILPNWVQ